MKLSNEEINKYCVSWSDYHLSHALPRLCLDCDARSKSGAKKCRKCNGSSLKTITQKDVFPSSFGGHCQTVKSKISEQERVKLQPREWSEKYAFSKIIGKFDTRPPTSRENLKMAMNNEISEITGIASWKNS